MLRIRNVASIFGDFYNKIITFYGNQYFFRLEKDGTVTLNVYSKTQPVIYQTISASSLLVLLEENFNDEELLQMKWNGNHIFYRTNEWQMEGNLGAIELIRHEDGKDNPEKEFTIYINNADAESTACFFSLEEARKIAEKLNELVK